MERGIVMKATNKQLVELLTVMLRARTFEEKAAEAFTSGLVPGFIHVGIGQEAVAAGVCARLRPADSICITHRGHVQAVAKGMDLKLLMAELFGKKAGLCKGRSGSIHIADKSVNVIGSTGIVGAGLPVATGAALSYQIQGTDQVAVCFFGDGAVNQGTFHESLNMASLWKLPVVYCCENNRWAQFTPQKLESSVTSVSGRAAAYDIPGITVDGCDVMAVYEAAGEAVDRARKKEGPTLLEFSLNRWYGHYVGDPQRYRDEEDVKKSRQSDPIAMFKDKLVQQKILTSDEIEKIEGQVSAEMDEAVKFAQDSPLPEVEEGLERYY
jgi:TPP-dependent pyruvate/acetoin dehydrogenase alpha subunit